MAFDCVFVDFGKNDLSKEIILKEFPYAKVTKFIGSYFDIIKSGIEDIKTEYFWFVSDLVDLKHFDFGYIPEQYEQKQIHVWNGAYQAEGDVMLIPTEELRKQIKSLKHLRDFRDINYHVDPTITFDAWPSEPFTFDNLIEKVKHQKQRYVNYYYRQIDNTTPSFWEDQKLYVRDSNKLNLLIPKFNVREELYEYSPKYMMDESSDPVYLDICYIHNGEPQAQSNLKILKEHVKHLPNKLHVIEGVQGRRQAYQTAARESFTEYFYAVFAKLKVHNTFGFDFVPDTLKSPRHYIFDCYNPVIDYTYGHQAIILYNRKLTLNNDGTGLDFTLAQKHDHIPLLSAETVFYTDPLVCYRTAFREIVKLMYYSKIRPTVETDYILKKWFNPNPVTGSSYVIAAGNDAREFVEKHNYNFEELFKSYEWDFVDDKFKKRYG